MGSIVESFDWNIYAVLAPFFAASVFGDGSGKLLAAYAGFAVGFLARPVGSIVIGRFSDRYGRRLGLLVSMSGIALASLGIALLPTAAAVGVLAGVLAVVLRLIQGLAYGGETPTVAAYVTEAAPVHMRWRYSAVAYGGIVIGSLLAFGTIAAMYAIFGREALNDGAWRWGFVAAAAVGLFAIWVRRSAPETESFEAMTAELGTKRPPIGTVFREHRWACLAMLGMTISGTIPFYFALLYMPVYGDNIGVTSKESASSFMTLTLALVLVTMLALGWLADQVGILVVLRIGYVLQILLTAPLLLALKAGSMPFWVVALVLGLLVAPAMTAINVYGGLLFPPALRAVGGGIVNATTVAVFGGTFPLLAEWLHERGGYGVLPYYVTFASIAGLLGTFAALRSPSFVAAIRGNTATIAPTAVTA
ncbi:hypothetical protein AXK60_23195 [Tsukamurella pseudospumae]|uniref:Major facilitator superfamily (MFS) profile domain-containing protein n=1 Tax=Tsukamurella pseudospumae TaxID=239498 RepID=A0A138ATW7_9ACTN|nr:hypothetical protein AXK61_07685 [Tsukamurella pseudospumae]KXP13872.1 hypothetical protein AXK60_23195 [Tsukamurella pseudospumae]